MSQHAPPPDGLIVITLDRLPGWMLSATGCTWVAMPALDALAARGLVFDRLIADTDRPHDVLAVLAGGPTSPTDAAVGGSWPLLAAAGWSPAVITDDARLAAALAAQAEVRHVPLVAAAATAATAAETNLGRLFAAVAEAVRGGRHRLVWCHATSLGAAWDAPLRFREQYADPDDPPPPTTAIVPDLAVDADTDPDLVVGFRQVMAGQLTMLDGCLGSLVEALATRGGNWTILVAGVRGIGLGLHGRIGCGPLPPFGELVHLPAILVDHRGRMAAQRHGGLVLPADLGRTLRDLIGLEPHVPVREGEPRAGRSLAGLFEPSLFEPGGLGTWTAPGRDRVICRAERGTAVATPAWHLLLTRAGAEQARPRLYAKPDDYFEVSDVANRCPAVAEELTALATGDPLEAWTTPLSAETQTGP